LRGCCSVIVLLSSSLPTSALHSFPTRRSSDLAAAREPEHLPRLRRLQRRARAGGRAVTRVLGVGLLTGWGAGVAALPEDARRARSEEHTSELQSRFDLVCRLLPEKKKAILCVT